MFKSAKPKEKRETTDKARSFIHFALGYLSSLERLIADISIQLNSLQLRS